MEILAWLMVNLEFPPLFVRGIIAGLIVVLIIVINLMMRLMKNDRPWLKPYILALTIFLGVISFIGFVWFLVSMI